MPQVLKDNCVVKDNWTVLAEDAVRLPKGDLLLSYSQWQTFADQIDSHDGDIGVIIEGNSNIEEIIEPLLDLPVIAINFPKFADGRGFSTARLIRERYNYSGEIRAVGGFIRDQLYLLSRCGFNAFKFDDANDLTASAKSLQDFSETYQVSADEENPLFRRR
ncbi:MAG: DUF934 domain-containing protein [Porticoccaceae bacterium]